MHQIRPKNLKRGARMIYSRWLTLLSLVEKILIRLGIWPSSFMSKTFKGMNRMALVVQAAQTIIIIWPETRQVKGFQANLQPGSHKIWNSRMTINLVHKPLSRCNKSWRNHKKLRLSLARLAYSWHQVRGQVTNSGLSKNRQLKSNSNRQHHKPTSWHSRSSCGSNFSYYASSSKPSISTSCKSNKVVAIQVSRQMDLPAPKHSNMALRWPKRKCTRNFSWRTTLCQAKLVKAKHHQLSKKRRRVRASPTIISLTPRLIVLNASRWPAWCLKRSYDTTCNAVRVSEAIRVRAEMLPSFARTLLPGPTHQVVQSRR